MGSAFAWRRATGERETCWRKRGVSLVSGVIGCLMLGICAALVGSAFALRRATGERETCWRKRGVSLVSGIIVVSRVSQKSAPQELPTRVTHKSVPQECLTKQRVAGERDDWWYFVICLLLVCGGPLQRCADTARNAPRLALLSHNVALPFHLHIDVYTPSPLYTHRHRYTHRHTHTQRERERERPTHLLNTLDLTLHT